MSLKYYHLYASSLDEAAEADDEWLKEFKKANPCCRGCSAPQTDWGAVDAYVNYMPRKSSFSFVTPLCVDYMSRELLSYLIDAETESSLLIGNMFDELGRRIEEYATIACRHKIVVRGGVESLYRQCELCGDHVYSPMGKYHILRSSITPPRPIYQSHAGFVVTEEICRRVSARKWKHAKFAKLPILDKPLDGRDDLIL